ncbi:MAG: hypothetical protein H7211_08790, partial [Aquabacterium sp.]|nr:hypothetical protein [Ferruginibacter sp.]
MLNHLLIITICTAITTSTHAQISITGPTCVTVGTSYNYTISGNWTTSTSMQWCITGGVVTGSTNTCKTATPYPNISVTWTSSGSGSISLSTTNPSDGASKAVTVTQALTPGLLTSGKTQNITYNTIPPTALNCPTAIGGYCTPSFTYVWQSSIDNLNFNDIAGASGLSFTITTTLTQTTYYRNKVTEINSNTIGYSDVATIFVFPKLQGGTIAGSQTINYNTQPAAFTSTLTANGGNCSGSYAYLWQQSTDNITFKDMSLFTGTTSAPRGLTATTYFRRKVTCGSETAYSNTLTVITNPSVSAGIIAQSVINIASGTSPGVLVADAASGGACGNSFVYQWQSGSPFADISGATGLDYTPGTLTTTTNFIRKVTCGTDVEYSNVCQIVVGTPLSALNYIRVRDITATGILTNTAATALTSTNDVKQSTQYVDGLGRLTQTVAMQASPLLKDMVSIDMYDNAGRETVKYLPFISATTDGNSKPYPLNELLPFNSGLYSAEQYYLSHSNMEASGLNRVLANYAPGINWLGGRKGTSNLTTTNTAAEVVRVWYIATAAGSLPTSTSTYGASQLMVTVSTDEMQQQVLEYKDKEGNVILKKVQLATAPGIDHTGWLCTYYIYDDLGQLRFVMPPKATDAFNAGTAVSTFADELCFRYEYDSRHRMTIKKIPGAAEVWMAYDARDRMNIMQDGNLRASGKWMVTVYDNINRPFQTGLLTDATTTFANHQTNDASVLLNYPSTATNFEQLTQSYYEDYTWVSGTGTTLTSTIDATNFSNAAYFYTTTNASPDYALPLTPKYGARGMATGSKVKIINSSPVQYIYTVNFYDDKGIVIQSQTINSSTGKDINTTQYNFSRKPLRSMSEHNKAVTNAQSHKVLTKIKYDFMGRMLTATKTINSTVNSVAIAIPEKTILQNTYNELGQLITKKIGNQPNTSNPLETLSYDYNIRGWLLGINRGYLNNSSTSYFGMELAYDKTTATPAGTSYAAAQYNGNIAGTVWKSKGDGVNRQYNFGYDNANRLLKAAFIQNNPDNSWNNSLVDFTVMMGDGATAASAYDANGNILKMQQWGLKVNASAQIDNLVYNYTLNSNKLQNVIDGAPNDPGSKLGDFRQSPLYQQTTPTKSTSTIDYTYDPNGNLVRDYNKDLVGFDGTSGITYNYLNLPSVVTVKSSATANKGTITYTYDAAGNKLMKQTVETNVAVPYNGTSYTTNITTLTTYIGGFVYQSKTYSNASLAPINEAEALQLFSHEEGRVRFKPAVGTAPATFAFDYFIKDHLGNVRMVITDEQQTDIYPVASLEPSKLATEKNYYDIKDAQISLSSAATGITSYTNDNGIGNNPPDSTFSAASSTKLYRLNSNEAKTGLGITLKVMAGDKIDVFGKSYYFQNTTGTSGNSTLPVLDLLTAFLNAPAAAASTAVHGLVTPAIINTPTGTSAINTMMGIQNTQSNATPTKPRAFINVIFFDEQFKAVSYQISMAGSNSIVKDHHAELQNIVVPKNGFVY